MAATLTRSALCRTPGVHRAYPSLFTVPGLHSQPVWKSGPAHWKATFDSLKQNLPAIREEYQKACTALPSDYIIKEGEHTLHQGDWEWRSLITKGNLQPSFQAHAPTTTSILLSCPDLLLGVPFSYAFFSTLKPGTVIAPHYGPANIRIRVHFPLHVPSADAEQLGLGVAGEVRHWTEGEPLLFDDCFQHGVWNKTEQDRVVLLFDLWHPDLAPVEREGIQSMFSEARQKGWLS